jgi:hypothetical protein
MSSRLHGQRAERVELVQTLQPTLPPSTSTPDRVKGAAFPPLCRRSRSRLLPPPLALDGQEFQPMTAREQLVACLDGVVVSVTLRPGLRLMPR